MVAETAVRFSSEALRIALALFYNKAQLVHRLTETVDIVETRLRRTVSVSMTIPYSGTTGPTEPPKHSRLVIPLLTVRRGHLLDNFDVADGCGCSVPVLSQDENKRVARLLLESRFDSLAKKSPAGFPEDQLSELKKLVLSIPQLPPDQAEALWADLFEGTGGLELADYAFILHDNGLCRLSSFFCRSYLTSVELTAAPSDLLILKYSYDSGYDRKYTPRDQANLTERFRRKIRQRPYSFAFDAALAFTVPSYHFLMAAPEGHYCSRQSILGSDLPSGPVLDASPKPYGDWPIPSDVQVKKSADLGMPYAHLYIYGLIRHATPTRDVTARVVFYEIPPGATGFAFLFALATAVSCAVLTIFFRQVSTESGLAAIFLSLIGVAALWLRPTLDRVNLLQAPLSARVGLFITGSSVIAAALCLIVAASFHAVKGVSYWVPQGIMIAVSVVMVVLSGYLFWKLITNYRKYRLEAARPGV